MSKPIIEKCPSIMAACDLPSDAFAELVKQTADIEAIASYKVGFRLGLSIGLPQVVKIVRESTNKPVIYDHQKAANDIPDTGKLFCETCAEAGIDAIILFPFTGPKTLEAWVRAANEYKLGVIVGGVMTHPGFLASEGGSITPDAVVSIYVQAAELGVEEFVVPGTRPEWVQEVANILEARGVQPIFHLPGIGAQGGAVPSFLKRWHAIVGRSLAKDGNYRANALALADKLLP